MGKVEIEARFKEVNADEIVKKVIELGGRDMGVKFLEETIFYDSELKWREEGRYVRLRSYDGKYIFTYKHIKKDSIDGAEEIEFGVDDPSSLRDFIERLGLIAFRTQQKKRHTLDLDGVIFDIDQWPIIPAYLEIEGESEVAVRSAAERAGLNWKDAIFLDARKIIEGYGIDVSKFKYFTFEKCE
jgi:adenylate cyclase, class 2